MTGNDFEYRAGINDQDALAAIQRINKQIEDMAKQGQKNFKRVEDSLTGVFKGQDGRFRDAKGRFISLGKVAQNTGTDIGNSATASAAKIGVIGGIVGGLTNQFIEMGREAIRVLIEVGERSVQTALEFDTLRSRLLGIFDGSQEAADATFTFIRDRSKALGIDLGELAGAFLPKVESLDQFERVAKIATALARSDPDQGVLGARLALIEAVSGTFTSLQKRFEFDDAEIERIKTAFEESGIEGFLTTLEQIQEETGKSFDVFADTAQGAFGQVEQAATEKLGQLGEPIVESLQRAAENIGAFLEQNDTDISLFVRSIGDAIASVIDFVGSIDFSQLDTKSLVEFGQYIFRIVEATKLFIGQAVGFIQSVNQIFEQVTVVDEVLGFLADTLSRVDEALVTASQILALSKAGFEAIYATIQPLVDVFYDLFSALGFAITGNFSAAADSLNSAVSQINAGVLDLDGGLDAAAKSLQASAAAMAEYGQAVDDQADSQENLRAELEDTSKAGEDAANAILAQKQAAKEAEQALAAYEAALAKVNEQQAKLETELEQSGSDINLDVDRKRFDALQDFGEKRAQAARKNLQKITDIEKDYNRDLEDVDRDRARERIEADKQEAQERVDIEEKFNRQIADIRQRFGADLIEAERKRDAVTFLRLQRQQQEEVQQAQTGRDRDIEDTKEKADLRREELRQHQQWEEEDARISLERKLEDQRVARDRELEEIRFAEIIKEQEIKTWLERQLDDLNTANQRKQEALRASLEAELAIIAEYEAKKTEVALTEAARREEIARQANTSRRSLDRSRQEQINQQIAQGRTVLAGRQHGGPVSAGGSYLVGERGPEIFTPNASGNITPSTLMLGTIPSSSIINNINNSRSASLGGLVDPGSLDPILAAKVQNLLISMLSRM